MGQRIVAFAVPFFNPLPFSLKSGGEYYIIYERCELLCKISLIKKALYVTWTA